MSVNLQQIATYLDNQGLKYSLNEADAQIMTGVESSSVEQFLIVIQLDEKGEFLKLFAPEILAGVKTHRYKEAILETMLTISWETKMLQWEYDPSDGEVRAMIEFPIEDSTLTERQFFRCLSGLVETVDNIAMPRLQKVMDSGRDPAEVEVGERLLLTIQEEAPGLLDVLEKAMEARKRRGNFPHF
jgi:hypothetical protein